jgi:hypothetical protein
MSAGAAERIFDDFAMAECVAARQGADAVAPAISAAATSAIAVCVFMGQSTFSGRRPIYLFGQPQ